MVISLCANELGCAARAQRFCENDSDSSCDSSRVILWKTWLQSSRITIFLNVIWV